ncbi:MAG TPA: mandelate racemase/muconate lactonizing enzyme family protein [Aestuariivirgaceae bacterium]|nr:mandelate racemase/muconate lactonizing enzyme family protein [Aestuariivirgaceae bacterium]
MKIASITATPLFCAFKQPYHWSRGINHGAPVILIEVKTDAGITGIGESVASPSIGPVLSILNEAIPSFVGKSAYDGNRLIWDYYLSGFNSKGTGRAPRYFSQAMTGIELALWDAVGKAAGQPLHRLLGGAVHDSVKYFGFVQGDTPAEIVGHARMLAKQGFEVLYVKTGRGNALDLEIVRGVRKALPDIRLRLDSNEAWDMLNARVMFKALEPCDIEFIEQPLPARTGSQALAELRGLVDIPIAADQTVYGPEDVLDICRTRAADVIVLGLHETCGVVRFRKAAAVAEAAGLNVCIHGVFETGITTSASNQVAASIGNIDDGNQIMCQLLTEDIVAQPSLRPVNGTLPVSTLPGLGFELDRDAVGRAKEAYTKL